MILRAVFLICLLVTAEGSLGNGAPLGSGEVDKVELTETLCAYMDDPLWSKTNAYDAAHVLMVPLEYAFFSGNSKLKRCFSRYFSRLQKNSDNGFEELGALTWLQHLHLAARYAVLENDIELSDRLRKELNTIWRKGDAWLWGRSPFTGIATRIEWKLNADVNKLEKSYYNVIFDEDYFALALGIDLYGIYSRLGKLDRCGECQEAKDLFLRVFEERVTWIGDRWLIDVDYWRDHPDFAFSGYFVEPIDNSGKLLPKEVAARVTIDSSHAHRYPSWLRSADLALEGEDKAFVNRLQQGLRTQFNEHILSESTVHGMPLLNNYMDGRNGYFRYNYATHSGARKGYSPFALSGTLSLGWWAMLGGEKISQVYFDLFSSFPLSTAQRHVYDDPSTRERHPVVAGRFDNSLLYVVSLMASELSSNAFDAR